MNPFYGEVKGAENTTTTIDTERPILLTESKERENIRSEGTVKGIVVFRV